MTDKRKMDAKPSTPARKAKPTEPKPYKNHKPGSRKGEIHKTFDEKGADAAKALGVKLGLKPTTLSSWINQWKKSAKSS